MEEAGKIEKRSQIHEQIDNLRGFLSGLHEQIDNLHDELDIVLRQSLPVDEKASEKTVGTVPLVDLACTIKDFGGSVTTATSKIRDIIERLEL